ncbi:MAG: transcriptional regulator [Candidatus Diapherotrites archaeon CG08_land_8_20_14_0_20_34_12]|nr:MAG: transcriptional regulator [Candidatus Diapherotrites archaeon CG08_land_8_20_14_0_20_34_12]
MVENMYDRERILSLEVRRNLYDLIKQSPGVHFRELKRRSNLAIGSLQYHLSVLERGGFVICRKEKKFARYFPLDFYSKEEDKTILSLANDSKIKLALLHLLKKKKITNEFLSKQLNLSPSTISFHLNKLVVAQLIDRNKKGRKTIYSLKNPEKVIELLGQYRKGLFDDLADNFVDLFEKV